MKISQAYIEITNRCNLNCAECYNRSGLNKKTVEISPLDFRKIIRTLHYDYGVKIFDISGGEPVLHSKWNEILQIMEEFKNCSFLIVTNGTLKNDKLYELLETSDSFIVQFSIDGASEETHSKLRGKGNFKKTISNIKSLNPKNSPIIKMVLSKHNINQLEDYFKLAANLRCIPAFSFSERTGNANDNWDSLHLTDIEKIQVIEKIKKLIEKYDIETKLPYATFDCPLAKENDSLSICIKPDGSIQPCQNLYDSKFSIGTIYDFDGEKMKKKLHELREKIINRNKSDYNCSKCIIKEICKKGCPAHAFNINRNIYDNDGACQFRRLQVIKFSVINQIREIKEQKNA